MTIELWRYQDGNIRRQAGETLGDHLNGVAIGTNDSVVLAGDISESFAVVGLDANSTVLWRFQDEPYTEGWLDALAMAADGSVVVAGTNDTEDAIGGFAIIKLDEDGAFVWKWQNGSSSGHVRAVAMGADGSVIFAGGTTGDWNGPNAGDWDFAAGKLDPDGSLLWTWQNGTSGFDEFEALAMGEDGSVVLAGASDGDFTAVKLDADGNLEWTWQTGTSSSDELWGAAMADDGSIFLAGATLGNWNGSNENSGSSPTFDFAVTKLDSDGGFLWAWQGGTELDDKLEAAAIAADGSSVFLAGYTYGSWDGTNAGEMDFAALRLDANGDILWTWQDGTTNNDTFRAAAVGSSGFVVFAGYTEGDWGEVNAGTQDVAAVMLEPGHADTLASTFALNATPAPSLAALNATSAPLLAPTPAPSSQAPTSMIAGVVAAVAAAAMIVTFLYLWMRRVKRKKRGGETPVLPLSTLSGEFEHVAEGEAGRQSGHLNPGSFLVIQGNGSDPPPHPHPSTPCKFPPITSDATSMGPSAPVSSTPCAVGAVIDGIASSACEETSVVVRKGDFKGTAREGGLEITTPTAEVATAERPPFPAEKDDLPPVPAERSDLPPVRAGKAAVAVVDSPATLVARPEDAEVEGISSDGRRAPLSSRVKVAEAVMHAATALAERSSIPGVSEAATLVSILVNLVLDNHANRGLIDGKVRWCNSIVIMLQRAAKVLSQGEGVDGLGDDERVLVEDVHEAVGDLVQVMQAYKTKNRLSQVLSSSLLKRRQEEAEAVIDKAISRLDLGLHIHVGEHLKQVGRDVLEGLHLQRRPTTMLAVDEPQVSVGVPSAESLIESRRLRRRRRLNQMEIPEGELILSNEVLGKGAFGSVYLADYNGRNVAAKVMLIDHDVGNECAGVEFDDDTMAGGINGVSTPVAEKAKRQRKLFLRELHAMIRLRSPHTVNVYGAITGRNDRLILVMELLAGGDLRTFLKYAQEPLPHAHVRRIVKDICAGMVFLHGKNTVHGDLKSANVLFDAAGRAKIGDFGTSRWAQHTHSTGLCSTYATKGGRGTQMSFAWAAPEVFDDGYATYASDMYSFGMVVWEILSRDTPWSGAASGQDIYRRVVIKGERPVIPENSPADAVDIMRACWVAEPPKRPTSYNLLERMKKSGRWTEG